MPAYVRKGYRSGETHGRWRGPDRLSNKDRIARCRAKAKEMQLRGRAACTRTAIGAQNLSQNHRAVSYRRVKIARAERQEVNDGDLRMYRTPPHPRPPTPPRPRPHVAVTHARRRPAHDALVHHTNSLSMSCVVIVLSRYGWHVIRGMWAAGRIASHRCSVRKAFDKMGDASFYALRGDQRRVSIMASSLSTALLEECKVMTDKVLQQYALPVYSAI